MSHGAPALLTEWSNFYVMLGSSAAALTGLMFVVITLVNRAEAQGREEDGIATFSTPTVLHFCAVLIVAAILNAPWRSLTPPALAIGITGLYGVVYVVRVIRRTTRLKSYVPDLEDWVWFGVLPFVAYAAILGGAVALLAGSDMALFVMAGGAVLLTFAGIRNAWDVVTFLATRGSGPPDERS